MTVNPSCEKCGLYKQCEQPFKPGLGDPSAGVVVISESVLPEEDRGEPAIRGPLERALEKANAPYYHTHLVRCCPYLDSISRKGVRTPSSGEERLCTPLLEQELAQFPDGTTVVTLGNGPLSALVPTQAGITKEVGKRREIFFAGRRFWLVPNHAPGSAIRNPNLEGAFSRILLSAFNQGPNYNLPLEEKVKLLNPQEAVDYLLRLLSDYEAGKIDWVLYDSETTSFLPWTGDIIMFSFATEHEVRAVSIPTVVNNVNNFPNFPTQIPIVDFEVSPSQALKIRCLTRQVLETIPLVGHNLKFDLKFARVKLDVDISKVRVLADTLILAHHIYGRSFGTSLALKPLCRQALDVSEDWDLEVHSYLQKFRLLKDRHFGNVPTGLLGKYAALDSYYNRYLYVHLRDQIREENREIIDEVTFATVVYTEAETEGMWVDPGMLNFLDEGYKSAIVETYEKMYALPTVQRFVEMESAEDLVANEKKKKKKAEEEIRREHFNPGSNNQLKDLFYATCFYNLPIQKRFLTEKGAPQTGADIIEFFLKEYGVQGEVKQFLSLLEQYKIFQKLHSTYIKSLPEEVFDGSLKPEFNLTGTVTGRLSSGFHTLPSKSDIKRMFASRWAGDGGLFLAADQSQLEVRIAASIAGEDSFIEAYKTGLDVHTDTAAKVYGKTPEEVTGAERKHGKTLNFGIIYGKGSYSLALDLKISEEEAQRMLDNFFAGRPKLKKWIDRQHEFVDAHAYVVTPMGRLIPVPDANSPDPRVHQHAYNQSSNYPIQSSASDLVLCSSNEVYRQVKSRKMKSLSLGAVHDSLEYDVYPGELPRLVNLVKYHSEEGLRSRFPWVTCPLVMDISIGTSWGSAIEFSILDSSDNHLVMEGSAMERDLQKFLSIASLAYKVESEILEVKPLQDKDFEIDVFVRDSKQVKARIKLSC